MRLYILFLTSIITFLFTNCTTNTEVDLIVYNAKVYTVDSTFSNVQAFAVKNGIFIDIGNSDDILKRYKAKETVDAQGKPVYPGFYDAHVHFFLYANLLQQVDLSNTKSFDEVLERLKVYKKKNPDKKWIIGGGWDQNSWVNKDFPTKDSLDKYFPNTPIFLNRIDYHAALVNSEALRIAQIDTAIQVEGGLIASDTLGQINGILIDNAMALVSKYIPSHPETKIIKNLRQAEDSLFAVGITSIVDAGLHEDELDILKKFYSEDSLRIRNYAMILAEPHNVNKYLSDGIYESDKLTVKSLKFMADGALGSRGACLLAPYEDSPSYGFILHHKEEFEESFKLLANSPFQVSTHAIGDSANRLILDLYGKYLPEKNDRRWRIEHAQIVSEEDFSKFRTYNIFPSVQPTHATSDMAWLYDRIGRERAKGAYAYKELLKWYGKIAIGSDFPVEHFNPLYSFHAAVTRQNSQNLPVDGFQLENALTREQALKGMTIWAAYSCFQEKKRGSIEKGKDADFVILDKDIMITEAKEIRNIKTLRTVVGGNTVYLK